jgi:hypothetical protein
MKSRNAFGCSTPSAGPATSPAERGRGLPGLGFRSNVCGRRYAWVQGFYIRIGFVGLGCSTPSAGPATSPADSMFWGGGRGGGGRRHVVGRRHPPLMGGHLAPRPTSGRTFRAPQPQPPSSQPHPTAPSRPTAIRVTHRGAGTQRPPPQPPAKGPPWPVVPTDGSCRSGCRRTGTARTCWNGAGAGSGGVDQPGALK